MKGLYPRRWRRREAAKNSLPALLLRIKQRIEWRLVRKVSEIRILARLQPVTRLYFNGALQMLVSAVHIAMKFLGGGHPMMDMVILGSHSQVLLQMLPGFQDVA